MTKFQRTGGGKPSASLPIECFNLDLNIDLSDYALESGLSNSRKDALWSAIQRARSEAQVAEIVSELDSNEEGSPRTIEEVPLSSKRLRYIEKQLEHSREDTRSRFLRWAFSAFGATLLISGGLIAFAVLNPEKDIDTQAVKDWTHLMVTAEVGFISGAAGFYFARKPRSEER